MTFCLCTVAFAQETGVVINGVRWATCNVDGFGTFAPTPESLGKLYRWNRPDAWGTADGDANWPPYNYSQAKDSVWASENCPCPEGWRVPTIAEIDKLLETAKVKSEWGSVVAGRKFTDQTNGNFIFLPAAGLRVGNDGTLGNKSEGFYWSNTEYMDKNSACYLKITSTSAVSIASPKGEGHSIRCVKAEGNVGINTISVDTENAVITGYFDVLGRKLKEEPTKGFYIIQYDNGKTKKMMKIYMADL
jgi:uncharacterized protein (TIGR02145 family)